MTNVHPGDLALVVGGNHTGATCTVLRDASQYWPEGWRTIWECEFPRPMHWAFPRGAPPNRIGDMPDCHLRRITGPHVLASAPVRDEATA